jgi:hypothetical protein
MNAHRITLAAALAVALVAAAAPAAAASRPDHRPVVVPAGGKINGEWIETLFAIPAAENPLAGNADPCVRLGHRGKVLSALALGGTVTCTAEQGTVLFTGWDHWCSSFDDPDSEFYAVGRAAQRKCAKRLNRSVTSVSITVDDAEPVDILKPRFAAFTPLTTVHLPAGNLFDVAPQTGTVTSYGWLAYIRPLRVGRHVITTDVVDGDFSGSFKHIIDVVRRSRSDHREG